MSEKQVNCILAFGVSAVLALMSWISLWSFLALPFIIILITEDNEDDPKLSSPKELKIELEKAHDQIETLEYRLSSARHLNANLQNRLDALERELAKLTVDPEAEMREIELAAEREITGGA
jgi:hypothetical protein